MKPNATKVVSIAVVAWLGTTLMTLGQVKQAAAAAVSGREATIAMAEVEEPERPVEINIDVLSTYTSRGQVNNDEAVVQPSLTVERYGFGLNVWGNLDLTDRTGHRNGFSEVDFTFYYCPPIEAVELELGVAQYEYPSSDSPPTAEVYGKAAYPNTIATPIVEVYYDFREAEGFYVLGAIEREFELGSKLVFTPGFSTGWGSSKYNDCFFGVNKDALNDGNVYGSLKYSVLDGFDVSVMASYMWLWDSEIKDGASDIYFDDKQFTFGGSMAYAF